MTFGERLRRATGTCVVDFEMDCIGIYLVPYFRIHPVLEIHELGSDEARKSALECFLSYTLRPSG